MGWRSDFLNWLFCFVELLNLNINFSSSLLLFSIVFFSFSFLNPGPFKAHHQQNFVGSSVS